MAPDDISRDPRVYLAEERTYLAWIRTSLALMAFGFVVARFGLFVTLHGTGANGLIPLSALPDDYWMHDETSQSLHGRRTRQSFRLAQEVTVRLREASPHDQRRCTHDSCTNAPNDPAHEPAPDPAHLFALPSLEPCATYPLYLFTLPCSFGLVHDKRIGGAEAPP